MKPDPTKDTHSAFDEEVKYPQAEATKSYGVIYCRNDRKFVYNVKTASTRFAEGGVIQVVDAPPGKPVLGVWASLSPDFWMYEVQVSTTHTYLESPTTVFLGGC